MLDFLRNLVSNSTLGTFAYYGAITFYASFVGYCALRGLVSGISMCEKWWDERRVKYTVNNEILDPILNICMDTMHITFYITSSVAVSSVVAASAPISVPIMACFSKKIGKPKMDASHFATRVTN
jgi:hypothetical protein